MHAYAFSIKHALLMCAPFVSSAVQRTVSLWGGRDFTNCVQSVLVIIFKIQLLLPASPATVTSHIHNFFFETWQWRRFLPGSVHGTNLSLSVFPRCQLKVSLQMFIKLHVHLLECTGLWTRYPSNFNFLFESCHNNNSKTPRPTPVTVSRQTENTVVIYVSTTVMPVKAPNKRMQTIKTLPGFRFSQCQQMWCLFLCEWIPQNACALPSSQHSEQLSSPVQNLPVDSVRLFCS